MTGIEDALRAEWAHSVERIRLGIQHHPIGFAVLVAPMVITAIVDFIFMRRRAGFWKSLSLALFYGLTFWLLPMYGLIRTVKAREKELANIRDAQPGSLTDRF